MALFPCVPASEHIEVQATKDGFALSSGTASSTNGAPFSLTLTRGMTVEGHVILGGETPDEDRPLLRSGGLWAKVQDPWRYGVPDDKGFFRISDVSQGGSYFNLHLVFASFDGPPVRVAPSMMARYIPDGWDQMLTSTANGHSHSWIGYIISNLPFEEGKTIQHDLRLIPMAHLSGTIPQTGTGWRVWYDDSQTIYSPPHYPCDAKGHFDILVPHGDITLHYGQGYNRAQGTLSLKGLKAFDERKVAFTAQKESKPVHRTSPAKIAP